MKNNPWISIITVVFNNKDHIRSTIESVLGQTCPSIEFIIIDGGSTDGSLDIIRQYEKSVDVIISEPDLGIYDAMNKGISKAGGTFILFLNSGDSLFDKDTITQVSSLQEADIYYGETAFYKPDNTYLGLRSEVTTRKLPSNLKMKNFLFGMPVSHQSFIVRKSIAPGFDLKYACSADIDWCIKCLKESNKTVNTNITISKFQVGGFSDKNRSNCLKERFSIYTHYFALPLILGAHLVIFFRYLIQNLLLGKKY
jgi:glycosyltransferase involved in cell wall biosynthesis